MVKGPWRSLWHRTSASTISIFINFVGLTFLMPVMQTGPNPNMTSSPDIIVLGMRRVTQLAYFCQESKCQSPNLRSDKSSVHGEVGPVVVFGGEPTVLQILGLVITNRTSGVPGYDSDMGSSGFNDSSSNTDSHTNALAPLKIAFARVQRATGIMCDEHKVTEAYSTRIKGILPLLMDPNKEPEGPGIRAYEAFVAYVSVSLPTLPKPHEYYQLCVKQGATQLPPFLHPVPSSNGSDQKVGMRPDKPGSSWWAFADPSLKIRALEIPSRYMLPNLWLQVAIVIAMFVLSGLFSGLTIGLLSLDPTELTLVLKSGTPSERRYAQVIVPLRRRGNFLLCSLVLGNVLVNAALTLLLENLSTGTVAVVVSTLGITIFGEILPQAICKRHGLRIGARTAWVTKFFMFVTAPLSLPLSWCLDKLLGEELGSVYDRQRLVELVKLMAGSSTNGRIVSSNSSQVSVSNKTVNRLTVNGAHNSVTSSLQALDPDSESIVHDFPASYTGGALPQTSKLSNEDRGRPPFYSKRSTRHLTTPSDTSLTTPKTVEHIQISVPNSDQKPLARSKHLIVKSMQSALNISMVPLIKGKGRKPSSRHRHPSNLLRAHKSVPAVSSKSWHKGDLDDLEQGNPTKHLSGRKSGPASFFAGTQPSRRSLDKDFEHKDSASHGKGKDGQPVPDPKKRPRLLKDEVDIITGALVLVTKTVGGIMTPLSDVFAIAYDSVLDFATMASIVNSGFTRVPVYREPYRTDVVGLLNFKDLAFVDPNDRVPLRTLLKFYNHVVTYVFEDTPLYSILEEFKKGDSHMAFVRRVITADDKDPWYEIVGLVTLEDVIEEIIQSEIWDETDKLIDSLVHSKRRTGKRRKKHHGFSLFWKPDSFDGTDTSRLTPQMALVAFQYLKANIEAFKEDHVSSHMLRKLLKRPSVIVMVGDGKRAEYGTVVTESEDGIATERPTNPLTDGPDVASLPTDPYTATISNQTRMPDYLYTKGKLANYFILILEGKVRVYAGQEDICFDSGPFSYFGLQALNLPTGLDQVPAASAVDNVPFFIPDYTVIPITDRLIYLKIRVDHYDAVATATRLEREREKERQTEEGDSDERSPPSLPCPSTVRPSSEAGASPEPVPSSKLHRDLPPPDTNHLTVPVDLISQAKFPITGSSDVKDVAVHASSENISTINKATTLSKRDRLIREFLAPTPRPSPAISRTNARSPIPHPQSSPSLFFQPPKVDYLSYTSQTRCAIDQEDTVKNSDAGTL